MHVAAVPSKLSMSKPKSSYITVVILPEFATKNHIATLSLLPPTWWDGEENQKEKRQKSVG